MFNNKAKSKMDLQTADTILQNVFKACDVEPNNISIEKLEEKAASNHKKDNILIIITAVILLISILIPLILKFVLIPSAGTLSAPTLAVASQ